MKYTEIESALEQTRGNDNLIENQIWTLFGLIINCFVSLKSENIDFRMGSTCTAHTRHQTPIHTYIHITHILELDWMNNFQSSREKNAKKKPTKSCRSLLPIFVFYFLVISVNEFCFYIELSLLIYSKACSFFYFFMFFYAQPKNSKHELLFSRVCS